MPVNIYRVPEGDEPHEELAWLCDDEWRLAPQIDALAEWIGGPTPPAPGDYIADIGFQWRRDAASGGAVLGPDTMRRLADAGVTVLLSEYPGFAGESESGAGNGKA